MAERPAGPAAQRGRARRARVTVAQRIASGEFSGPELAEQAHETALRMLTAAPKSRAELRSGLMRKGYPESVADPLVERLAAVGLLDDEEYAAMIVRTRYAERGLSRRAIGSELRRRGIPPEIAEPALSGLSDDDEDAAARRLARARLPKTRGLDRNVRLRRVAGALARRGYGPDRAFEIVRQELEREGEAIDDNAEDAAFGA